MSAIKLPHASGNSVSIAAPESNPAADRTLYLPSNADGTIVSSTYGPTFFARGNSSAVANDTNTLVPYTFEKWDSHSCYDTSNSRFTPNLAGYYHIHAIAQLLSISGRTSLNIRKNGSRWTNIEFDTESSGNTNGLELTTLVAMNGSTDYIDVMIYQASGSSKNLLDGNTWSANEFSGYWVRGL